MIFEKDDLILHYEIRGEGQPILMLHGMPADRRSMIGAFEPIFKRQNQRTKPQDRELELASTFQRVYVDLPGMGNTAGGGWIKSNDNVVAVMCEFVETVFGKRPFLLAGFSYGGYIARGILYYFQAQVDGMILMAPVVQGHRADRTLPPPRTIVSNPSGIKQFPEPFRELIDTILVVQEDDILARQYEVLHGIQVADHQKVAEISENYSFSFEVDNLLTPFEKPVLIVMGRHDHITGYADPYLLVEQYPRSTYVVFDRAGHGVHIEQSALFTSLVLEWLNRVKEAKTL
ncbi:MAG: alpha/beta hydrolase [Chloroflexota bacterium]